MNYNIPYKIKTYHLKRLENETFSMLDKSLARFKLEKFPINSKFSPHASDIDIKIENWRWLHNKLSVSGEKWLRKKKVKIRTEEENLLTRFRVCTQRQSERPHEARWFVILTWRNWHNDGERRNQFEKKILLMGWEAKP